MRNAGWKISRSIYNFAFDFRIKGDRSLYQPSRHPWFSSSSKAGQQNQAWVKDSKAMRKARAMSPGVGLIAGIFGSLVGVGGGVIITPMIVNICKTIPQRVISGTSLAAVFSTAVTSGANYADGDCIDFPSAICIASVAMLTAPYGARLTGKLDCTSLRRTLGYFLIAASPLVPLKAFVLRKEDVEEKRETIMESKVKPLTTNIMEQMKAMPVWTGVQMAFIGSVSGLASGLLGVGGGVIITPTLALTTTLDHATVLGTSLFSMIPPSAVALMQHYKMGNVDPKLGAGLMVGTAIGGWIGSKVAVEFSPPGMLEACFSLGMLFLGRKTLKSL